MNAGARDREIVLQTATVTQDTVTGAEVLDWDEVEEQELYAEWVPSNTREVVQAQARVEAVLEGLFRIEYIDRPDPKLNRIVWEGRVYNLLPPVEIGRRVGWEIPVIASGEAV